MSIIQRQPYLSIVATSRNDQHGNNTLQRTAFFVKGLIAQCTKFQLPAELILVEWNPPSDAPPLHSVLPIPPDNCPLSIRYITVPAHMHQQYANANQIPLYQMIAKNVGIRRAKGEFVLCTNVDLLFSDKLFHFLATRNLKPNTFYRADRCDVPDDLLHLQLSLSEQLQWCKQHIIKRWSRNRLLLSVLNAIIKIDNSFILKGVIRRKLPLLYFLHLATDACGDFTLMHRNAWQAIQGYPELDMYSIHIDTLGIASACALGYEQMLLPSNACTYHIHHEEGWTSLSPIEKIKFLEKRPGLGIDVVISAALATIKKRTPFYLNSPTWGLANETLEEVAF